MASIMGIVSIVCVGMYIRYDCAKPAISIWQAFIKRDNANYFIIVRETYRGEWGGWCYLDGREKMPVYLLGRTPQSELSSDLSSLKVGNRFLVKGTLLTEYNEFTEKDVIMVENWEIIAPINRTYGTEAPDPRMNKSLLYLDRHDVEIGAYRKIITDIRAIKTLEEKLIWKNSEIPCHYITSDVVNGKVQWYLEEEVWVHKRPYKYKPEMIPISLEGVPLESHFNENILGYFNNEFLVKGKFDKEKGILEVIEWDILVPIKRANDFYHSPVYFTEDDVLKGIYIP